VEVRADHFNFTDHSSVLECAVYTTALERHKSGKESVERSGRDWVGETMHTRTKSLGSGLAGFWS